MNVLILGGTGFIGKTLTTELLDSGYEVSIVTRNSNNLSPYLKNKVRVIEWDNTKPLSSVGNLKAIDVVVNLAGESIGKHRWTSSVKKEIWESRINITREIVSLINDHNIQPKVLINASAVGYYGPRQDELIVESEPGGQGFLAEVCRDWENEAYKVQNNYTRVVTLRVGMVLGVEGALNKMLLPFKFYLGGPLGTGTQWWSWIHIQDLVRIIRFIIEHSELQGPINGTAPEPVKMKKFARILGEVLDRPAWLPVPEFMLRLALGQMSEMLVQGQRVVPEKLIDSGFEFRFPNLSLALEDALARE